MMTRLLRELVEERLVAIERREDGSYRIVLTEAGRAFREAHAAYFLQTFRRAFADHYRFGRAPRWAAREGIAEA